MMDKGDFFNTQDRYLYEPFEQALFHWDHVARTIRLRFVGDDYVITVGFDHRIFNEAIRTGREVTEEEFEAGSPSEQ